MLQLYILSLIILSLYKKIKVKYIIICSIEFQIIRYHFLYHIMFYSSTKQHFQKILSSLSNQRFTWFPTIYFNHFPNSTFFTTSSSLLFDYILDLETHNHWSYPNIDFNQRFSYFSARYHYQFPISPITYFRGKTI